MAGFYAKRRILVCRGIAGLVIVAAVGVGIVGNALADGLTGAPQFPELLNGYAVRPGWKVAGVDYYVGTPSGTVLKDPSTISMAGVSVNKSAHVVTVTGSDVTLNAYDFGLNGGWQVNVVDDARNATIQNSRFEVGAGNFMPIQAYYGGSINVLNNTFDGGASRGSGVNAMVFTGGGATIEYNRFTNFPNDGIDITRDGNFTIRCNLFDSMGIGDYHSDAIQTYFSALGSLSIQYNTLNQPPSMSNQGMNSFVRIGDQKGKVVRSPVAAYNTVIMASEHAVTANVFQWQGQDGIGTLANPAIHDNFIDPKGVQYSIVAPMLHDSLGVVHPVTFNNVDLTTGKQLLSGPYNSRTSGVRARPPMPPVITGARVTGGAQVQLAGSAAARSSVAIFDNGELLDTVTAQGNGAWSYASAQLGHGDHSFTARATDAFSNSSGLSTAWLVAVTASGAVAASAPSAPTEMSTSTANTIDLHKNGPVAPANVRASGSK